MCLEPTEGRWLEGGELGEVAGSGAWVAALDGAETATLLRS